MGRNRQQQNYVRLVRNGGRLPGNPYRGGKSPFVLPGEGSLSGMSYRRRSDVFDKEEPVAMSGGDRCWNAEMYSQERAQCDGLR